VARSAPLRVARASEVGHTGAVSTDDSFILDRIDGAARAIASLRDQASVISSMCEQLRSTLQRGGAVLTCGNGGSAAEAMHLAEELIGKYAAERPPLRGICLNADATALTCIANDFGFEEVFARSVRGLARTGDALVAFSTSGKSVNILRALEAARQLDITTVGLLGKGGGPCAELCDHAIVIDSDDTAHIQEAHQVVVHLLLEAVERSSG